jgi:hypothetical protein
MQSSWSDPQTMVAIANAVVTFLGVAVALGIALMSQHNDRRLRDVARLEQLHLAERSDLVEGDLVMVRLEYGIAQVGRSPYVDVHIEHAGSLPLRWVMVSLDGVDDDDLYEVVESDSDGSFTLSSLNGFQLLRPGDQKVVRAPMRSIPEAGSVKLRFTLPSGRRILRVGNESSIVRD